MVTMIDEIFDRHYHAGRDRAQRRPRRRLAAASATLSREAFAVLNRIEYSAPWTAKSKRVRMQ